MASPASTTRNNTGSPKISSGRESYRSWPGHVALWTAFGTTLANEVVRHFAEYVVAPPRPDYPLAPASLWLVAVVAAFCGAVALTDRRPGLIRELLAAGLGTLGLLSAVVAAVTPNTPAPPGTIPSDPVSWLLLGVAAAGLVLAVATLPGEVLLRTLFAAGLLVAALSVLAVVIRLWAIPSEAQDPVRIRPGTLPAQGIFMNINILGMVAAAAFVVQVAYLRVAWRRLGAPVRWLLVAVGPVTSLVLVWTSSSRTAIGASLAAVAIGFLLPWRRWRGWWPATVFAVGCAAAVLMPIYVAVSLGYKFGGRRDLWPLVFTEIAENPVLGRGFGNINGEQHAHNQLLETWLQAGLLGLLVLLALALLGAITAVRIAPWDGQVAVAVVTFSALLWGTEIVSPWTVTRTLPLPLLFSLLGLLAGIGLARDRGWGDGHRGSGTVR
ncbi:MAG: O-antigen ligase family protein [Actinobacteria bacterium]|nr:O-antigen ligase family protein [Actinomycetota bacterium]